jgi:hypothetical protein
MAEIVGRITNIKLTTWLSGGPNEFDTCMLTVVEANGNSSLMILWNSRSNAPTIDRIRETQRLALAREAAFRRRSVHVWHESGSSIITSIQVDIP